MLILKIQEKFKEWLNEKIKKQKNDQRDDQGMFKIKTEIYSLIEYFH